MSTQLRPATEWELAMMVAEAANTHSTLEIMGSATKRSIGRPVEATSVLDLQSLRGVQLYEPSELVMRARAGTRINEIERELASKGQMLAFEPLDTTRLLDTRGRNATIGGVIATNLSGSRRVAGGSARDHIIGIRAVTGQAECIGAGGRVLKNVTGYDLPRALTGTHGTLAAITEVTFKVFPMPEATGTLLIQGLPDELAIEALCTAMSTPFEVSGAVHLPAEGVARLASLEGHGIAGPLTALRLENVEASVRYRSQQLKAALAHFGEIATLDTQTSLDFWQELRELAHLVSEDTQVWRISVAPKTGPMVVGAIAKYMDVEACYDWSGGLVWLLVPTSNDAGVTDIRRVIALYGGHATLIKATPAVRAAVDVFQPMVPGIERLTRKLKEVFDPYCVLNPGRMYATV